MLRWIVTAVALILTAPMAFADLESGLKAYQGENYEAALGAFKPLAESGDAEAQYRMCLLYDGDKGVETDARTALDWFRKAAEGGNLKAKRNLAYMYYFGAGVRRDYEKAAAMFKEMSEAGLGRADYDLGRLYYRGQGVEKDAAKATAHFRKAVKKGHGEAQFFMGRLYMLGQGVEKDPVKAYYWPTLSIAQDTEKAAKLRRKVSGGLDSKQIAQAEQDAQAFRPN